MQLLQIKIRKSTAKNKVQNITHKLQGVRTLGFINLQSRNRVQTEGKKTKTRIKIFATKIGLKVAQRYSTIKQAVRRELQAKTAFILSLRAVTLERAIQAKKQLLKYGYSFEKTVQVAKAYLNLRQFKQGLSYSLKSLIFA
jgi:hypothetical protein